MLARHVQITVVHDEHTFYEQLATSIAQAQTSIWVWSGWVAGRVRTLLPLLSDAVRRGVRVTVFVRDPSDPLQRRPPLAAALEELRAVVPRVVEVNLAHQKVVIIDERIVMLGSLNVLSQRRTREVMVTMQGHYWARRLLTHLHAEELSQPPRCQACHGRQIDLRQRVNGTWFWHCYNATCPARGQGRNRAWTQDIILRRR